MQIALAMFETGAATHAGNGPAAQRGQLSSAAGIGRLGRRRRHGRPRGGRTREPDHRRRARSDRRPASAADLLARSRSASSQRQRAPARGQPRARRRRGRLDDRGAAGLRTALCLRLVGRQPHLSGPRRHRSRSCRATTPRCRSWSTTACSRREEARHWPRRNVITRAIGVHDVARARARPRRAGSRRHLRDLQRRADAHMSRTTRSSSACRRCRRAAGLRRPDRADPRARRARQRDGDRRALSAPSPHGSDRSGRCARSVEVAPMMLERRRYRAVLAPAPPRHAPQRHLRDRAADRRPAAWARSTRATPSRPAMPSRSR